MFSKSLESALAAMAYLAEIHDSGPTSATAVQIAEARGLNRPFVSKMLTQLSAAGLVVGKPGPKGGFCLSRPPGEISLLDVAQAVGHRTRLRCCLFGEPYGEEPRPHCPLHDQVCGLRDQVNLFLADNTLDRFRGGPLKK